MAYSPISSQQALPTLTSTPTHYPDCCLSLSTTFFHFVSSLLLTLGQDHDQPRPVLGTPKPALKVFSIGSGTGLLEALLTRHLAGRNVSAATDMDVAVDVVGVEVYSSPAVNKYLDDEYVCLVRGTWDICAEAEAVAAATPMGSEFATAWMFVYPRHVKLVERYIDSLLQLRLGTDVRMVIWAGPRADLEDYEVDVFDKLLKAQKGWVREKEQDSAVTGVAEWEAVVVLKRL